MMKNLKNLENLEKLIMKKIPIKILNEITQIYFGSENIKEKEGGWLGYIAFYNPQGDNIHLMKISISYETKILPPKEKRIKELKKEIKKRFEDPCWNLKGSIKEHYAYHNKLSQKKTVGKA